MDHQHNSADRLSFTIFLALALHALLIFGISFSINKSDKLAPTLNITLATHKSAKAPDKADFLAQHNQEASGSADEVKELKTTELAQIADVNINQVNPLPQQQAAAQPKPETELLDSNNERARKVSRQDTEKQQNQHDGQQEQDRLMELKRKMASLQAKLDQEKQTLANKPRIKRFTSTSTKSSEEAAYYNRWSQKVERIGTDNFPEEARRSNTFGSLRLSVSVRPDGSVARVELLESSGYKMLDQAALRIVRLASPFDPFPPEIKKQTDLFEIIRTWNFEIGGLSTSH
ncbi:TonB family protein [Agaribacterium haliotis]|uniref:TonB family protein n=1 Tax=Agaribacterium haliotis TaxID=2013869 RepID=UPI000BB59B0F|nr:energy transducer TonB [Agaribacterium haliotis]